MKQSRQREVVALEENDMLKLKIVQLQNEQNRLRKTSKNELDRLLEENKRLQEQLAREAEEARQSQDDLRRR